METKYHIIRGDRSGVFFGEIEARNGGEVTIRNARRLWFWSGAASLSQLAIEGVKNPNNCKFTVVVPSLTILDAIEILPCTREAACVIQKVPVWKV